jgi:hypothetical protein
MLNYFIPTIATTSGLTDIGLRALASDRNTWRHGAIRAAIDAIRRIKGVLL